MRIPESVGNLKRSTPKLVGNSLSTHKAITTRTFTDKKQRGYSTAVVLSHQLAVKRKAFSHICGSARGDYLDVAKVPSHLTLKMLKRMPDVLHGEGIVNQFRKSRPLLH